MRMVALAGLLVLLGVIVGAVRYLSRAQHSKHSSGVDQFSPSDPAKTDLGPNPP
jgi:hypothetical protein